MTIRVYNSLTRKKEDFIPIDPSHVKMYVCGPTVYNTPHIGNIRSAVVYDVVFRVLMRYFEKVTYVRNITDVDDKIIDSSKKEKKTCAEISEYYTDVYHDHLKTLHCLSPTLEPKATENIDAIIRLIQELIDNSNAYEVDGHVYFDVTSFGPYGELSGRKLEDLIHGARIEVGPNKRNPGDFVLWKPDSEVFWPSPWGNGRPGWHIECSAMSIANLGQDFDIHGGGADLKFPHHENEIAQSRAAYPGSLFAKYWLHNGFLTVNGEKMSKSLGNIITIDRLVGITPNVIRFVLLSTHYSKPLNWHDGVVEEAKNSLLKFKMSIMKHQDVDSNYDFSEDECYKRFFYAVTDDFNIPNAVSVLHEINEKTSDKKTYSILLKKLLQFLGIHLEKIETILDEEFINLKLKERNQLKKSKEYEKADLIRETLNRLGVIVQDGKDGRVDWFAL